jgi:hypothetical protein
VTGAVTVGPEAAAAPTVHVVFSGPMISTGAGGRVTGSLNTSVT